MTKNFTLISFLFAFYLISCTKNNEQDLYPTTASSCSTISAKYTADIKPLFLARCTISGCHNTTSNAGGFALETYTQVAAKAAKINQRCIVEKNMPAAGPLSNAEIAMLKCWIDSGAPNN